MEWKNKTCPLYDCEDRKELSRVNGLYQQEEKDKNLLYAEVQQLRGLISEGALSIQNAVEEVLKVKDLANIDKSKISEILSKVFNDKKISDIISQNLSQKRELHDSRLQAATLNMQLDAKKEEIRQIEGLMRERERKDINSIKDLNNMDAKSSEQVRLIRENAEKLTQLKKEVIAFDEFKQERITEIMSLRKEHEELIKSIKQQKEDVLKYRTELNFYGKYKPRNVKKFEKLCNKSIKLNFKGKKDKALKCYNKALALHNNFGTYEQVLTADMFAKTQEDLK